MSIPKFASGVVADRTADPNAVSSYAAAHRAFAMACAMAPNIAARNTIMHTAVAAGVKLTNADVQQAKQQQQQQDEVAACTGMATENENKNEKEK